VAPRGTAEVLQTDPVPEDAEVAVRSGVPHKRALLGEMGVPRAETLLDRPPSEVDLSEGVVYPHHTDDMAWGMYSDGTMTKEEVMETLGLDEAGFSKWLASHGETPPDPWAGFRGNVKDPSEYGADEYNPYTGEDGPAVSDGAGGWVSAGVGEGAARGGRLEANLAAREALGAPYVEDPSRLHAVATGKVLDPNRDVPGYEDEEVQKVKDNLAKQAEMAYQDNLTQLMRQFAVMGSAGSGAFMMANNNLAAKIYGQLLDEYAQIDLKNLDQIEIDLQEEIGNLVSLSQLGYANKEDFLDTLEKIDSVLFSSFTGMLEVLDLPEHLEAEMFADLAQFLSQHYSSFATGEVSKEDLIKMGNDHLSSMVEEYAETKASKEAVFSKLDEIVLEDSTKTASPPSGAEPPFYSGQYDGDVVEDSGNVWIWLDGEWTWYGVYDK
jgi:hypothetical protein